MNDIWQSETESSFKNFMNSVSIILLAVEPTRVAGVVLGIVANVAPSMVKVFQKILRKKSFAKVDLPIPSKFLIQDFFALTPRLSHLKFENEEQMRLIYNLLVYESDPEILIQKLGDIIDTEYLTLQASRNYEKSLEYVVSKIQREKIVSGDEVKYLANELIQTIKELNATPVEELELIDVNSITKKLWGKTQLGKKWEAVK